VNQRCLETVVKLPGPVWPQTRGRSLGRDAPSRLPARRARLEDGGHPPLACEDARHYEVEFRKTGGHDRLKVKSMTILVDGRETAQFVQRSKDAGKFCVTITGR